MDISINNCDLNAEYIFNSELAHLGNETKRKLIELLASSLTFTEDTGKNAISKSSTEDMVDKHFGKWQDARSSET